jgi:hypothetical protein
MQISQKGEKRLKRFALYLIVAAFVFQVIEAWESSYKDELKEQSKAIADLMKKEQPRGIAPIARMIAVLGDATKTPEEKQKVIEHSLRVIEANERQDIQKLNDAGRLIDRVYSKSQNIGILDFIKEIKWSGLSAFVAAILLGVVEIAERKRSRRMQPNQTPEPKPTACT